MMLLDCLAVAWRADGQDYDVKGGSRWSCPSYQLPARPGLGVIFGTWRGCVYVGGAYQGLPRSCRRKARRSYWATGCKRTHIRGQWRLPALAGGFCLGSFRLASLLSTPATLACYSTIRQTLLPSWYLFVWLTFAEQPTTDHTARRSPSLRGLNTPRDRSRNGPLPQKATRPLISRTIITTQRASYAPEEATSGGHSARTLETKLWASPAAATAGLLFSQTRPHARPAVTTQCRSTTSPTRRAFLRTRLASAWS
jgi:hypothetical protein